MKNYIIVIFLLLFHFAVYSQINYDALVKEYNTKIANAKTVDEKLRLAKELQQKLGVQQTEQAAEELSDSKPQNAETLGKSILCNRYKASITFSSNSLRQQNCSDCGSPCPLIQNGTGQTNGNFTIVANLCDSHGFYTMAASDDLIFSSSGDGGESYSTKAKACGPEETSSGVFKYDVSKKPSFNFTYQGNNKWSLSLDATTKGTSKAQGGESEDASSIGFSANETQGKCEFDGLKFTINGVFTDDQSRSEQKLTDKSTISYKVIIEPDKDENWQALIMEANKGELKKWLPQGKDPSNPNKLGNSIALKVIVRDKQDTTKIYTKPFKIIATLQSTHYPGYCSNYPSFVAKPDIRPDMRFDSLMRNATFTQTVSDDKFESNQYGNGAVFTINSFDYGGFAKLYVKVVLQDKNTEIAAGAFYKPDLTEFRLPMDRNDNQIGDAWEDAEGIYAKKLGFDWDEDVKPDNGHYGDNILLIDEYRGFVFPHAADNFQAKFERLSPNQKELFIKSEEKYADAIEKGVKIYGDATKIRTLFFKQGGYLSFGSGAISQFARIITFNSPLKHETPAIIVYANNQLIPGVNKGTQATNMLMPNVALGNGAYFPLQVDYIYMCIDNIEKDILKLANWFHPLCETKGNQCFPGDNRTILRTNAAFNTHIDTLTAGVVIKQNIASLITEMVTFSVAHELGHATHVHHHNLTHPGNNAEESPGYYTGVSNCPMRYWALTGSFEEATIYQWYLLYLTGNWKPSTGKTPLKDVFEYCKKTDNCFYQLDLKP